ncbi:MAG: hypothetical protein AAFR35_16750 [Pseudomonadota bacterium]
MEALVWGGAALTLMGIAGLIWCIVYVMRVRRADLDDDVMKARLQKVVAVNLAALAVSALGLMAVIVGIFLT